MTEPWFLAAAVVAAIVTGLLVEVVRVRMMTRHLRHITQAEDLGDLEECTVCALDWVDTGDELHVIRSEWEEREMGPGAGTAMVAYYCAAHCPGGCSHEQEHAA